MNEEDQNLNPSDIKPLRDAYQYIHYNGNLADDVLLRLSEQPTTTRNRWYLPLAVAAAITLVIGTAAWQGWFMLDTKNATIANMTPVAPVLPNTPVQPNTTSNNKTTIAIAQADDTDNAPVSTPSWPTETPGFVPSLSDVSAPSISFSVSSIPSFPTRDQAMAEENDSSSTTTTNTKQRSS